VYNLYVGINDISGVDLLRAYEFLLAARFQDFSGQVLGKTGTSRDTESGQGQKGMVCPDDTNARRCPKLNVGKVTEYLTFLRRKFPSN
jgi:hypothetical protein